MFRPRYVLIALFLIRQLLEALLKLLGARLHHPLQLQHLVLARPFRPGGCVIRVMIDARHLAMRKARGSSPGPFVIS